MTTKTKTQLIPLADRVLAKRIETQERTHGGIIIPDTAKDKSQKMEIVAVGPGAKDTKTGTLLPMTVKVGQKVIADKYAGTEIALDGEDYIILKESDILAIVE
jgi:chaperonin GroES